MIKYYIVALILHGLLFIHTNKINTLGSLDIPIKKNIPISYNVKNSEEKIGGIKEEKKVSEEKKLEPIKKEEIKKTKKEFEQEIKSKMNKSTKKKEIKKQSETKKQNTQGKNNNEISKNKNFIKNSDGTYTAISSKGIDFEIINQVNPDYPQKAEMIKYKNIVLIEARFLVGLDGNVEEIKILKSHEKFGFDKEVISALKKWKFKPIVYNGKKIKVYFNKEFVFTPK